MLYLPLLGHANGNFDALREMMMHPQAVFGLSDGGAHRGALVPGLKADVNVIDLARLHIHAPEVAYDLPASARRLVQKIDGYDYTAVSGQVTYERGDVTGVLPGRLLRGPQRA